MIKNHTLKPIRITESTNNLIIEACEKLGFKKADLIRFLLNRSLKQLKSDSVKAGGYENLDFSLREQQGYK